MKYFFFIIKLLATIIISIVEKGMVFYIIGLGLGSPQDITLKGLKAIKSSKEVYLEYYTSVMATSNAQLSQFLGVTIIEADRDFCQVQIDQLLQKISKDSNNNYSFLVVGDAFCATTHSDLFLRATKLGIKVQVIHNASIISAVGCTGLQVYRFGQIVSIPLWTQKWKPDSFYQKILKNRQSGLHTLLLVDIKVKQRTEENILKDKKVYQPPRFMTIQQCTAQLIQAENNSKKGAYTNQTKCFGLARIGYSNQKISSGPLSKFITKDMGPPLHSFVICAEKLHSIQQEMYQHFLIQ